MHSIQPIHWIAPLLMVFAGLVLLSLDPALPKLIGYALFVGVVVWMYLTLRHSDDEVVRSGNVIAMSVGAPVGLGAAFLSIFLVRFVPSLNTLVNGLHIPDSAMGPVGVGFGIGVLFACFLVVVATGVSRVGWWLGKR